ncbi:MAG TPA: DUF2905 domain-containing protein [Noviherbaspirillum sp.]|nr:DUF2905 domain-containing protein [Noviherbaspirillum sp.]
MIRWVAAIFIGLLVFYPLLPWLDKLRVGRLPGDVRFSWRGVPLCLPFGSTVVWALLALLIAEAVSWYCPTC